jgi:hypothetical protein
MTSQDMLQDFAQIAQQMETVGDLQRIGRALAGSFGVSTRPVTTDHLRWGVVAQPLGISDNAGAVKHFLSVLLRALRRARHFALVEALAFALPTKARS